MRSFGVRRWVLIAALGLLASGTFSCGLFDTSPGLYFNSGALRSGRLLLATHGSESGGTDVTLYTLTVSGSRTFSTYASGVGDPSAPHIVDRSAGGWLMGYGINHLTVRSSVGDVEYTVNGLGARQMAIALDPTGTGRMVFMDGSAAAGFDISYRTGQGGTATALTDDASPAVSYWTPAWSPDGTWILYARIAGSTGADAQLWRVHPDGSGAEQLPITTVELPTYAIFSPDGHQVFVPGDFTSYRITDGSVGNIDHLREAPDLLAQLGGMGYTMVGSALTGPVESGGPTTEFRHTFPISACWTGSLGDPIYFDALVARMPVGDEPPPEPEGVAVFSWNPTTRTLTMHAEPVGFPESFTQGWAISILHPTLIP